MRKCYYRRLTQRQHSAAQVNGKVALGDYAGAIESSNRAKTWAWVSLGVGLAGFLIWIPFSCIGFLF